MATKKRKPKKEKVVVEGEPGTESVVEQGTIVNVRAIKTGEHPSGVLRHTGDEFEFDNGNEEQLPHWLEDVDGKVETSLSPQELNEG